MHSAREGHKLDVINQNHNACIELECDVCLQSGGDIPCNYSSTFASVIAKGDVEIVESDKEKIHGLQVLMKHQTARDFEIDSMMAESVAVIRFIAKDLSAKAKKKSQ